MKTLYNAKEKLLGKRHPAHRFSGHLLRLSRGFTLVELMTVIAVVGIMIAIAIPNLMKWVPNYKLKAAALQLYGDVQKAKMVAIKTNRDVILSVTTVASCPGGRYDFTYTDRDGNSQTVASASMSDNMCIDSAETQTLGGKAFLPTGVLDSGTVGGTVTLTHTKIAKTYQVIQAWSGRTRIGP